MTDIIKIQPYELELVKILVKGLPFEKSIIDNIGLAKIESLDFTGVGYFLTISHPKFPFERYVCDDPYVSANFKNVECGFLIFLENRELTIECHTYQEELLKSFRTSGVILTVS